MDESQILNVYLYIARFQTRNTITKRRGLHYLYDAIHMSDLISRENGIEAGQMGISSKFRTRR